MIDLTPSLNPARYPAMHHAQTRANRENLPMNVFVAPPNSKQVTSATGFNVWYVRAETEGKPENAELFQTVAPETRVTL